MRLFVALDIDEHIRKQIVRFLEAVRRFASAARWVRPESLHVTLKFIGEKSEQDAETIKRSLKTIIADRFELNIRGYGFFPRARAPQTFWVGLEAEPSLAFLAATIDDTMAKLAIPKDEHPYHPHLTLARNKAGSAAARNAKNDASVHGLRHLQQELATRPMPEFGTMTAREFFLFQSKPSPGGSTYTKLARFALR